MGQNAGGGGTQTPSQAGSNVRLAEVIASLTLATVGESPVRRVYKAMSVSKQSKAVCRAVALHVGGLLDLGTAIREAVGQCNELWDGTGQSLGLKGEHIHIAAPNRNEHLLSWTPRS
jgi:hypothetical protein